MKNILICCGTSMITSSVVVSKLRSALEEHGIDAKFHQCKYSDVPSMVGSVNADLVVPTGEMGDVNTKGVPVINGSAFITGVRLDETVEKVVEILKD